MNIPKTSKCAVMEAVKQPLVIKELPIPEVEPGAILVKNLVATICGSDIAIWQGERSSLLPRILGHEMVGQVSILGKGVTTDWFGADLKVGDRIVFADAPCRKCYFCNVLHSPNLCPTKISYATNSNCNKPPYLLGKFSEYVYVLPTSGWKKVPDEVTNEEASPATCAFRTVMKSYEELGEIHAEDVILIQGAGNLGLYATVYADNSAARKVIVVDVANDRLAEAKKFGADVILNVKDFTEEEMKNKILALTDGRGADIVLEYTGVSSTFKQGVQWVRRGGRYVVNGSLFKTVEFSPWEIVHKQITVQGNIGSDITHYHKALEFIKNHKDKYPFNEFVTNKYKLENINDALNAMLAGKERKPYIVFE